MKVQTFSVQTVYCLTTISLMNLTCLRDVFLLKSFEMVDDEYPHNLNTSANNATIELQ